MLNKRTKYNELKRYKSPYDVDYEASPTKDLSNHFSDFQTDVSYFSLKCIYLFSACDFSWCPFKIENLGK